jgi:hypothetical protein
MKTKILLISAVLLIFVNSLFSQCISVELSVTWKMGYELFKKDSVISIPILNITYRNNCDSNLYFFKVSSRKDGSPMVFPHGLRSFWEDEGIYQRAKKHSHYTNQKFNVVMGRSAWLDSCWDIYYDTVDFRRENPNTDIRYDLYDIYEWVYPPRTQVSKNRSHKFVSSDAIPDTIMYGSVNDQFVFLKPNETHIDTYNLIGYKMVEGCFTFSIYKDKIENYLLTFNEKKFEEIKLPPIVGEYYLYSGAFNTNKVTVCFGEQ